jgi:UDP-N-acetylmuramoyl-L-alanyl-D-glutamate--2,6-diaminopimelate ligase
MTPHSGPIMGQQSRIAGMLGAKEIAGLGLKGLASDSRKVKPGYLFAALSGTKTDGARFVKDAVTRGAVAVLGEPALAGEVEALGVRFIADENPRAGLARLASVFFPGQPEIVAAVTGTKGKSSIVAFLREIWTALGKPAARWG